MTDIDDAAAQLVAVADTDGLQSRLAGVLGEQLKPIAPELLALAVTHRSYAYEHGGLPTNERLEFLGDAVLQLVVTEELYSRYPDRPEGDLAKLRSAVVNTRALAAVATQLGLGEFLLLGKGEEGTGGRRKTKILADVTEAVIGTIYLTFGNTVARDFVLTLVDDLIADSTKLGAGLDWKTSLQELTAACGLGAPAYQVTHTGPDHDRWFTATVVVDGVAYGQGGGSSKKFAEQGAAEATWEMLQQQQAPGSGEKNER